MTPKQKPEFLQTIAALAEQHQRELSPAALKLWWAAMAHWKLDDFKRAATFLARSSEFMPKPADFERLRANAALNPHEAWSAVVAHATGGYRTGAKVDAIVAETVERMGGFAMIGQSNRDRLQWLKRDFVEFYASVVDEKVAAGVLPMCLPGEQLQKLSTENRAHESRRLVTTTEKDQ